MNESEQIKRLADFLWAYMKPRVEAMLSGRTIKKKGEVTTAPSGGTVGVTFPFDSEITIPYVSSLSLSVGDSVWVESPDGNPINYIVTQKGDFGKAT